jgi:hypothetical protein
MPRYFLHIRDAHGGADDVEGLVLPSLAAASDKAVAGIRSLLCHDMLDGALDLNGRIEIADRNGKVLAAVAFADVVTITGSAGAADRSA